MQTVPDTFMPLSQKCRVYQHACKQGKASLQPCKHQDDYTHPKDAGSTSCSTGAALGPRCFLKTYKRKHRGPRSSPCLGSVPGKEQLQELEEVRSKQQEQIKISAWARLPGANSSEHPR